MADVIRFFLIVLGAVTTGAIVSVLRTHWHEWSKARGTHARRYPRHIWLVSLSHAFFVVGVSVGVAIVELGKPELSSWRIFLYIVAMALTLAALGDMYVYQKKNRGQGGV